MKGVSDTERAVYANTVQNISYTVTAREHSL
jgi:hypothetical protein